MNKKIFVSALFLFAIFLLPAFDAHAAVLRVSPNTGVYTVGKPFTVSVQLNTEGASVNAADGQLSFNPKELQVTGINRGSSIFNLWTEEPKYSNSAGTISFGGGSPSGYKGSSGNIVTITLKALGAGTPKINFVSGSVLAADGLGTNILKGMNGGSFTIAAVADSPEPEYVAPPNTPAAPIVRSATHPDPEKWYKEKTASLSWELPRDVTAVRMLLDDTRGTVPTVVYEERITEKTLTELDEGVSYFHLQFKNADGWGKITHYRLAVDTVSPQGFSITKATSTDEADHTLLFTLDDTSPILEYKIQIDGGEPFVYKDESASKKYTLDVLSPGHHTIIVEAFDSAGNSAAATYTTTVEAFEKPIFVEFPSRINTEVIPAIKGKTRPHAKVAIEVVRADDGSIIETAYGNEGSDPFTITSDDAGEFIYIPKSTFEKGVYTITAVAKDPHGRLSEKSDPITLIVETPGYIVFGITAINILSVLVPLVALVFLLGFGVWYLWHNLSRWKARVQKETKEAEKSVTIEFNTIVDHLHEKIQSLRQARKGKLSQEEQELITEIETDLKHARMVLSKEIGDIEDVISKR